MNTFHSGLAGVLAATIVACVPAAALAGKSNDTLVYASDSDPYNVSPYHNNLREGVIIAQNVLDVHLSRTDHRQI